MFQFSDQLRQGKHFKHDDYVVSVLFNTKPMRLIGFTIATIITQRYHSLPNTQAGNTNIHLAYIVYTGMPFLNDHCRQQDF